MIAALLLSLAAAAHALTAGAAKADITPDLKKGRTYMAGYGAKGRRPDGVHDNLHARVLVLREGDKEAILVGLDLLGFYRNDVEDLRRRLGADGKKSYLFIASTHQHAGPDTMGLWGPLPGFSGVDKRYQSQIKERVAAAVAEARASLEPVTLEGSVRPIDPSGICKDLRNPTVIDPDLGVARFTGKGGRTVATIVNYSCHPEVMGKTNKLISADFPGPLCEGVEEALGGTCVYLSGSIGGLLSPDSKRDDFFETYRIGAALARLASTQAKTPSVREAKPALSWKSEVFLVPVENPRYLAFLPALTFGHELKTKDGGRIPDWKAWPLALRHIIGMLPEAKRPWVETEVSLLDIGPLRLLGVPAEIFPELVIGGYDGRYKFKWPLIDPKNPDPPDLSKAPKGPYLKELAGKPLRFVVGLANDEIGYLVPEYDFKRKNNVTLLPRLPGHHYEETNSIGRQATGLVVQAAKKIVSR